MTDKIFDKAKCDDVFRAQIIAAYNGAEPLVDFCRVCVNHGFDITPGELIALGEEYSCNQLKSTNGGGVNPYDYYDDPFEMLMTSVIALDKERNK